ncbi:hypothetical protein THUN1379_17710 [Paludibacterium sp. THUN1379]|nr:hypothetical protein THUN1379_17710 [Paludibacterium sp. THUN1379]
MALLKWADLHDESIALIGRSGSYFDTEKLRIINIPANGKKKTFMVVIFIITAALFWTMNLFSGANGAILQGRDSQVYFRLTNTYIKEGFYFGKSFSLSDCSNEEKILVDKNEIGISTSEMDSVCNLYKTNKINEEVSKTIKQQLYFSIFLLIITTPFIVFLAKKIDAIVVATGLQKRLSERANRSAD